MDNPICTRTPKNDAFAPPNSTPPICVVMSYLHMARTRHSLDTAAAQFPIQTYASAHTRWSTLSSPGASWLTAYLAPTARHVGAASQQPDAATYAVLLRKYMECVSSTRARYQYREITYPNHDAAPAPQHTHTHTHTRARARYTCEGVAKLLRHEPVSTAEIAISTDVTRNALVKAEYSPVDRSDSSFGLSSDNNEVTNWLAIVTTNDAKSIKVDLLHKVGKPDRTRRQNRRRNSRFTRTSCSHAASWLAHIDRVASATRTAGTLGMSNSGLLSGLEDGTADTVAWPGGFCGATTSVELRSSSDRTSVARRARESSAASSPSTSSCTHRPLSLSLTPTYRAAPHTVIPWIPLRRQS